MISGDVEGTVDVTLDCGLVTVFSSTNGDRTGATDIDDGDVREGCVVSAGIDLVFTTDGARTFLPCLATGSSVSICSVDSPVVDIVVVVDVAGFITVLLLFPTISTSSGGIIESFSLKNFSITSAIITTSSPGLL